MISLINIVLYILAAVLLFAAYIVLYQFTYWKRHKVPYITPKPLLGNTFPLLTQSIPMPEYFEFLYKKHPDALYYGLFDLHRPALLIKDPELINEVCVKNFESFIDHKAFITEEMDPIAGRNIFSLKGQRWKEVRATLSPSYTAVKMKFLLKLMAKCSEEFVQYFIEHPEVAKNFDCQKAFKRYTNDVIATAAFGIEVNSMKNQDNEFFYHGKQATDLQGVFVIIKFLLMDLVPKLTRFAGITFLPKSTDRFFRKLITDTVKLREDKGIVRPDMIQLMIEAMKKEEGIDLTIDDIIGQALIFFLAGFDSSSSLMSFVTHELGANQDIQEKLYQEIQEKIGDNEITYQSLTEMKYLDMVINETLRKYPPAAATDRICVKEHKFPPAMKGYSECCVKKDVVIIIPIYNLHHDPKYFPEPDKFIPDRFSDENKKNIVPYTYIPFGLGPRKCIANRFALMENKIVIINILRKFVIKFTEKSQHPVAFGNTGFSLSSKDGMWLKFEERKKVD